MLGRIKGMAGLSARGLKRRPRLEPLERRDLLAMTFTVTNTADSGAGSLRAAITNLNADNSTDADSIVFNLDPGVQTIAPTSPLPAITRQVAITAAPAADGTPRVVLDGSKAGVGSNGLALTGGTGSSINGLAIVNFKADANGGGGRGILLSDGGGDNLGVNYLGVLPADTGTARGNYVGVEIRSANNTVGTTAGGPAAIISGNTAEGILIDGAAATNNTVVGSIIGADVQGTRSVGNGRGVVIDSASNNSIGGTTPAARNLISGNVATTAGAAGIGVNITGTSSDNRIEGNYIGVIADGTAALANGIGIALGTPQGPNSAPSTDAISTTTIGGTVGGAGNLISGNSFGIYGVNVTKSVIAGNLVGTNAAGTAAIGNGYGMFLGASTTTIGGTTPAARNVISGSYLSANGTGGAGIYLVGSSDQVQGNFVGTDITGTLALPNAVGMSLHVLNSTIGGTVPGSGNVIAGNLDSGIDIDSNPGNSIQGNLIGDANGKIGPGGIGNGGSGIHVFLAPGIAGGVQNLDDVIGGTDLGAGNAILGNTGDGIAVTIPSGTYNGLTIRGNHIGPNGQLGISLGANPTVPTPGTLTVISVTASGGSTTITGVLGGTPGQSYLVDVYNNTSSDPSGYGEGQFYLGSAQVSMSAAGIASFSVMVPGTLQNPIITATSTLMGGTADDPVGTTSEFSPAYPLTVASTDLGITQSVSSPNVTLKGIVTYTSTITNNGPDVARGVLFTDALDFSLVNATITSSVGTPDQAFIANGNVATALIGDLAPGESVIVTISALPSVNGPIGNFAGVVSLTPEANYANNTYSTVFTAGAPARPTADLAITATPSAATTTAGQNLTYTLTVANNGPFDATNVTVRDFLPAGAGLVSATPSQGALTSIVGNLATLNLGTIAAGASATVTVLITPFTSGVQSNTANVSGGQFDPTPGNNSVTTATTATYAGTPALRISQVLTPTAAVVGQVQFIDITVTNTGTAPADGVIAVDALPTGVSYVASLSSQGATPTVAGNVVTANLGTIAPGASAVVRVAVLPTAAAAGQQNQVAAVGTGFQPTSPVTGSQVLSVVAAGPSVLGVSGSRSNAQLVVGFSGPVVASSATTKANYLLYDLGTAPRALTAADSPISIMTAVYNAGTNSASLTPSKAIRSNHYYTLVVVGNTAKGIVDAAGRRLVGDAGTSGSNYSATFLASQLAQV